MEINAMMIKEDTDNVGVVTCAMKKGDVACLRKQGETVQITLQNDVPIYHKFCIVAVKNGDPIIKYGEQLGLANQDINVGDYVHTHNLVSQRDG